jgi:O-succinylbenzoic acid--CoA ligase
MSRDLSIREASATHGDSEALLLQHDSFVYRELAAQSSAISLPKLNLHRAPMTLQTALVLYRSLEDGRALCLVSPSTTDAELASIAERIPADMAADTALVLFTSGSDGPPKGVKLSRRALVASARASEQRLGWYGDDRWLCALPLSHVGGLSILLRCLVSRKSAYLSKGFEAGEVAAAILRHKISHISLVPTMLWRLLEIGFASPDHLQVTLMGGAALDSDLAKRARNAGFRLRLSYGMTESASQIVTDGRPLDGVSLRIQDDRLEVKGPMLMDGYLPPHGATPFDSSSWFRTQDRAAIDVDGSVEILGRADDLVISGGENIDPRAVEAGLNRCPFIATSLAFGIPHDEWGQELVALVVACSTMVSPDQLQSHQLSGHLRPKELMVVDALPLLGNGKVDHARARQLILAARDR